MSRREKKKSRDHAYSKMERVLTELTDDELRERLAEKGINNVVITPQTRRIYIRKLRKMHGDTVHESSHGFNPPTQEVRTGTPTSAPTPEPSDGFYVLIHETSTTETIFDSHSSATKAAKSKKGTRFKRFDSKDEAIAFISQLQNIPDETPPHPVELSGLEKAKVVEKELNPLSKIKTEEKNRMRKLMEDGKNKEFIEQVRENPKYLISSGDCPEIYHEGMRRNILHCAVHEGNLNFCLELFKVIRSDQFWEKLYPKDSQEVRESNRARLIDKYLNMQDGTVKMESSAKKASAVAASTTEEEMASYIKVKTLDTPLHIASKKGDESIVRFLMSFPAIDPSIRNYDNKTATEIACTRMSTPNPKLKQRIVDLINAPPTTYVPVYRSPDVCTLGSICILSESPVERSPIVINDDDTGSQIIAQAFAGPLSPAEANSFHKKWKTPLTAEEKKKAHQIRRSDPDRGLERIGRTLAHANRVGWVEYWEFLGGYYDLSEPEGLAKLEAYMSSKRTTTFPIRHDNGSSSHSASVDNTGTRSSSSRLICSGGTEERKSPLPRKILFGGKDDNDEENPLPDHLTTLMSSISLKDGSSGNNPGTSSAASETDHTNINSGSSSPAATHKSTEVISLTPVKEGCGLEYNNSQGSLHSPSSSDESSKPEPLCTPSKNISNQFFIFGDHPTKLDKDVYLAICDVPVDPVNYPNISKWIQLIKSFKEEDIKLWRTPKSNWDVSRCRDNMLHPPSPLLLSSPSVTAYSQSPLTNQITNKCTRYAQQLTPTRFPQT